MDTLARVFSQQTSAVEVVVFLLLVSATFLVASFLAYALLMALMRSRLPSEIPFRRILFPGAKQLRAYFGEYVLTLSTALLLVVTLWVKGDLVEQISQVTMSPEGAAQVAELFDYGLPPEIAKEVARSSVNEVVRPMLERGQLDEANLLIRAVIAAGPPTPLIPPWVLLTGCLALAVFYLVWLAHQRARALQTNPEAPPRYAQTFKALLSLGICVGLLLASLLPLTRGGASLLAQSALESIAFDAASEGKSTQSELIGAEIDRQRQASRRLYCPDCSLPEGTIYQMIGVSDSVSSSAIERVEVIDTALSSCQSLCESVRTDLDGLSADLESLRQQLAQTVQRVEAQNEGLDDSRRLTESLSESLAALESRVVSLVQSVSSQEASTSRALAEAANALNAAQTAGQLADQTRQELQRLTGDQSRELRNLRIRTESLERDRHTHPRPPEQPAVIG